MITSFNMSGLKDAQQVLRQLGPTIQRTVVPKATRTAATVIAQEVRRQAPVRTGQLRRLIRTRRATQRGLTVAQRRLNIVVRAGDVVYLVYPDQDAFYALFLEYGTVKAPARPFMRPAFDRSVRDAVTRFQERVISGVLLEVRKLSRQTRTGRSFSRKAA